MFELAVQATLSPWSLPPAEPRGWDTVLASWRMGGGGTQHSILGRLCSLHKYFKYFRFPPAIRLSCIRVPFSRYFYLYTQVYLGPYLDSKSSFNPIRFTVQAQKDTPRCYCCYHGTLSLFTQYNNKQVPNYERVKHKMLGASIQVHRHKMQSREELLIAS
jgi:hypothetical protein